MAVMSHYTANPDLRTRLKRSLVANDAEPQTPFGREARKAAAIRDAQDRFYSAWLKLSADMAAEIARIEREM
jgi:hypothetical protein